MTHKILWLLLFSAAFGSCALAQSAISVWIDTDIGNDFDDELAISYALRASNWQLEGISTTHWRHEGPCDLNTSDSSFVLAEKLMQAYSGRKVRVLRGNENTMANVYGAIDCSPNSAVDYLISVARAHSPERPLHIFGLGASSNIALALCRAPDIRSSIRVYLLAAQYDAIGDFWNKNEFNVQNDLAAFDYLLNARELDLYIMPANLGAQLDFSRQWLTSDVENADGLRGYLNDRWDDLDSMRSSWTAYDLALVVAIAQPQWVEWAEVDKPPENGYGKVKVATFLDVPAIHRHLLEVWDPTKD